MNPFDWSGPAFLGFYAIATFAVAIGAHVWTRFTGPEAEVKFSEMTSDPYRIAYLRGGVVETIRVALFNLVDRGILSYNDAFVVTKTGADKQALRRSLDRELVKICAKPREPGEILKHPGVQAACKGYAEDLEKRGFLADERLRDRRLNAALIAIGLLGGIAMVKIGMGLARGRSVWFLAILAIVSWAIIAWIFYKPITRAGRQALERLRTLSERLHDCRERIQPGGATSEALLLGAVYGLYELPLDRFPFVTVMFPVPKTSLDTSSDSGGDSGCSSGCGGGCGGCGGE